MGEPRDEWTSRSATPFSSQERDRSLGSGRKKATTGVNLFGGVACGFAWLDGAVWGDRPSVAVDISNGE